MIVIEAIYILLSTICMQLPKAQIIVFFIILVLKGITQNAAAKVGKIKNI